MEGQIVCKQNKHTNMGGGISLVMCIKHEGDFMQTRMEN